MYVVKMASRFQTSRHHDDDYDRNVRPGRRSSRWNAKKSIKFLVGLVGVSVVSCACNFVHHNVLNRPLLFNRVCYLVVFLFSICRLIHVCVFIKYVFLHHATHLTSGQQVRYQQTSAANEQKIRKYKKVHASRSRTSRPLGT